MNNVINKKLSDLMVVSATSIKDTIKKINNNSPVIVLLVIDENRKLLGTVTDGDIRRGLLKNLSLDNQVEIIMNSEPKYLFENNREDAKEFMKEHAITIVPILNERREIIDIILWQDVEDKDHCVYYPPKENIVFIMAGGKGTRLDPFTKILPKPLIPIGDKPILEIIMGNFQRYGFSNFILSLNYKAEMIKAYFSENLNGSSIEYIIEDDYLGTAGSLHFLKGKINGSIIVSNCDVILDMNFNSAFNYHKKCNNDATIVGVVRHVKIPYGILEMNNGSLINIVEKPEYDFVVNAGIYIIEHKIIEMVNNNEKIDMPDLLMRAKKNSYKVGVYPVSSNWVDIGQWEDYKKALDHLTYPAVKVT